MEEMQGDGNRDCAAAGGSCGGGGCVSWHWCAGLYQDDRDLNRAEQTLQTATADVLIAARMDAAVCFLVVLTKVRRCSSNRARYVKQACREASNNTTPLHPAGNMLNYVHFIAMDDADQRTQLMCFPGDQVKLDTAPTT
jgi:hypothetical protein